VQGLFNTDPDVVASLERIGFVQNEAGGFDLTAQNLGPNGFGGDSITGGYGLDNGGSGFDPDTDAGVGFGSGGSDPLGHVSINFNPAEDLTDAQWDALYGDGGGDFTNWWSSVDEGVTDWSFGFE
jgi:hypothetical protein